MAGTITDGYWDRGTKPGTGPSTDPVTDASGFGMVSKSAVSKPIPIVYGTAWTQGYPILFDGTFTGSQVWAQEFYDALMPSRGALVSGTCARAIYAFAQGPVAAIEFVRRDKIVFQSGTGGETEGRFDFKYLSASDTKAGAWTHQPSFQLGDASTAELWSPLAGSEGSPYLIAHGHLAALRCERLILPGGRVPSLWARVRGKLAAYADPWVAAEAPDGFDSVWNALPGDVIKDLLQSSLWGIGLPDGTIVTDVGPNGDAASSYDRYCRARGWFVGLALTTRQSALDVVKMILAATDSTICVSGSTWRVVPYGDTTIGSGVYVYTPPSVSIGVSDEDLAKVGDSASERGDFVEFDSVDLEDTYNSHPITYVPGYTWGEDEAPAGYVDTADVTATQLREAAAISLPCIRSAVHANAISALLVQRSLYNRATARIPLSWRHPHVEPADRLSLTLSKFGIASKSFRVVGTEEIDSGETIVELVEWNTGEAVVPVYTPQTPDGLGGNASSGSDPSRASIAAIASDSVFSAGEHLAALLAWRDLQSSNTDLCDRAAAATVTAEKAAWTAALNWLGSYLNGSTGPTTWSTGTPAWLTSTEDIAIDPETWLARWNGALNARIALLNALTAAAQSDANTALARLGAMADDSILSPEERAFAVLSWVELEGSDADLIAKASASGVAYSAYHTAFVALATYLNAGVTWSSGTPSWLTSIVDISILPATWKAKWTDAYTERDKLSLIHI